MIKNHSESIATESAEMQLSRHLEETGPAPGQAELIPYDYSPYTLHYVTSWHHDTAFACPMCFAKRRSYDHAKIAGMFPGIAIRDGLVEKITGPSKEGLTKINDWLNSNIPRLDGRTSYTIRTESADFETYE